MPYRIMQRKVGTGSIADPEWSNVVVLLHMDGVDDGTEFTDEKGHTFTVNGDAKTKTAIKKFGTASGYFDGSGDSLLSTSSDFAMGSGDYTFEFWLYPVTLTSYNCFFDTRVNNSNLSGFYIRGQATASSGQWQVGTGGGTLIDATTNLSFNQWQHIAFTRTGTVMSLYLNGTNVGTTTNGAVFSDNNVRIGSAIDGYAFNGYIDDVRITKGVARYTANFTPPTAAFLNS